jgi:hypothetical protein
MMRRHRTTLIALVTSGLLATGAVGALAGTGRQGRIAAAATAARSWSLTLSAAPDDLALAQVAFPEAGRQPRLSGSLLRVAVSGPFGDDYMAAVALSRTLERGRPAALVLLVNRPSALDDPVDVRLRLLAARSLGTPLTRTLANPFARTAGARPQLCDLGLRGRALSGSQLGALSARGAALTGFTLTEAVAQAYDAACGLPVAASFARAVRAGAGGLSAPSPGPTPAPTPAPPGPPIGKLPGEGCEPSVQHACPL